MDPSSFIVVASIALVSSVGTYFTTKYVSSSGDEDLHQKINSQIIIAQEKDNSHEFAQWLIIALIGIVFVVAGIFLCIKCAINSAMMRQERRHQAIKMQQIHV